MTGNEKIPLLIADDHKLFAHSFAEFINNHTPCYVVAIANDGKELLQKLNSYKVDIILLDINMPLLDGIATALRIKARQAEVKIIIVSQYQEKRIVQEAINAGVDGYFVKNDDPEIFVDVLLSVLKGNRVFTEHKEDRHHNNDKLPKDDFSAKFSLTPREMEVLNLMREQLSNREIAARLFLSQLTVETHTKSICRKLSTSDRNEVIKYAIAHL